MGTYTTRGLNFTSFSQGHAPHACGAVSELSRPNCALNAHGALIIHSMIYFMVETLQEPYHNAPHRTYWQCHHLLVAHPAYSLFWHLMKDKVLKCIMWAIFQQCWSIYNPIVLLLAVLQRNIQVHVHLSHQIYGDLLLYGQKAIFRKKIISVHRKIVRNEVVLMNLSYIFLKNVTPSIFALPH